MATDFLQGMKGEKKDLKKKLLGMLFHLVADTEQQH